MLSKYNSNEWPTFVVFQEYVKNAKRTKVKNWPELLTSSVDKKFIKDNKLNFKNTRLASSMFSDYLKSIENIGWGFSISYNEDKTYRFSGRSVPGSVNVREIVEGMKIGGGHDRAAGGKIEAKSGDEALEKVINWMKRNKPGISLS